MSKLVTVNGSEPITFEKFVEINTDEDVEQITEEEIKMVDSLEVGESCYIHISEVKRVK